MSKSFSFVLTLNILWFSLSTCYDESVIHYAPHRTEHASFLTNISQGSVATRLSFGGIFNDYCIANFLEILTVTSRLFDEVMCRVFVGYFFGPPFLPA